MKRIMILALLMTLVLSVGAAETYFAKGTQIVTPQVGLNSYAIPFGVSFEYGLTENIGIGGSVMAQFWSDDWGTGWGYSSSLITPAVEGTYHFTSLEVDKLDLFAGVSLGYSIYSWKWKDHDFGNVGDFGSSTLYLSPFLAARYYFGKSTSIMLKTHFSAVGSWSGVGAVVGVSFKLK